MIQPYDLPERLMGADPDYFIRIKLAKTQQGLSFFGQEALAEYIRCFRNPATIHAMCEDYRATYGVDFDMDKIDFAAGRKIACPALILWGATGAVGRNHKPAEVWSHYADRHPRRQGASLRALPLGRSAGGNLSRSCARSSRTAICARDRLVRCAINAAPLSPSRRRHCRTSPRGRPWRS